MSFHLPSADNSLGEREQTPPPHSPGNEVAFWGEMQFSSWFADGFRESNHPHRVDIYNPAPRQGKPG
jgi:hypothetical protein